MATTSSSFSSLQGSTIVVRPYIDSQPSMRCCTRCGQDFPGTSAYFKAFKKGGLAATCVNCTARISAAKRAKEQGVDRVVSTDIRGRKRRVLGDTDPNVQRKAPRLAPKEPARWDMASQQTREQMRLKAARERENRYRRNNSVAPVPTHSLGMDLPAFSSIPFPSRTPPPSVEHNMNNMIWRNMTPLDIYCNMTSSYHIDINSKVRYRVDTIYFCNMTIYSTILTLKSLNIVAASPPFLQQFIFIRGVVLLKFNDI
jgi:hypothetical protein